MPSLSSDAAWWFLTKSGPSLPSVKSEAWVLASYVSFIFKPRFPQLLNGDSNSARPVGLLGLKLDCVSSQMHVLVSLNQGCLLQLVASHSGASHAFVLNIHKVVVHLTMDASQIQ